MIDFDKVKSVADMIRVQAREYGEGVAQIFEDRSTTYAELDAHASRVAQALIAEGVEPDGRIGFLGKNSDGWSELLFGSAKAKAVVVGVNWRLAPPEVEYILNDAKAELLFVSKEYYDLAQQVVANVPSVRKVIALDGGHDSYPAFADWRDAQAADDPMLEAGDDDDVIQLYTSGTTGHPKGVQLTNKNYLSVMSQFQGHDWGDWERGEVNLVCMPFFHVAGANWAVLGFAHGATNVILRDVDPVVILELIEKHKVNTSFFVPAVILFLLQALQATGPRDFSSLRLIGYGASPIAEELLVNAQKTFQCDFVQFYGLTETAGAAVHLPPKDHTPESGKLRSAGKTNDGMEIRIVDGDGNVLGPNEVGEIQIRGGGVMKGYWNRPDATREAIDADGWFKSGDAGYMDDDGYLFIHDRVKDMIVSGGENIYPAEVENALFAHPAVADVAVIGVPDEKWGEAVKAVVVLKQGETATEEDLIAFCRTKIAGYKVPKSVDFVDELPRNPTGKILKRVLREPYWEGHDRQVN